MRGTSSPNSMSQVQFGPLDKIAPTAIPLSSIGVTAYSNHIDLQWPATTDDANGTGVFAYQVVRDGRVLQWGPNRTYSDTNVVLAVVSGQ